MPSFDGQRVLRDLYEQRKIGEYKTGIHRPTLSPDDMKARHWLAGRMREAGLEPEIDGIANVIGRSKAKRKLLAGSHIESQSHAGWLDGPLGVIYALEAARAINGNPAFKGLGVDVAAWCDEEGHFGSFLGSRSFTGDVTEAEIDRAVDRTNGTPMCKALADAGLAGKPRATLNKGEYIGFLEAHIEQGDWLEAHDLKLGIVTAIVSVHQYRITFEGIQNHAGSTRMAIRKDTGLAAVKLLAAIDERFPKVVGPRSVWTTGRIQLFPGDPSIIPGRTEVLFQFRDTEDETLKRLDRTVLEIVDEANRKGPCKVTVEALRKSIPARMDDKMQAALEAAAEKAAPGKHCRMPSGAGHDAQVLARVMPAGMLFVHSIGGISHHWTENTSDEDIVLGAKAFVDAAAAILKG